MLGRFLFVILLTLCLLCGCQSPRSKRQNNEDSKFPVGMWVIEDKDGNAAQLVWFETATTGAAIAIGGGTAIGSRFRYKVVHQRIIMTGDEFKRPYELRFDDSQTYLSDVTGTMKLRPTDDPKYVAYFSSDES